MNEHNVDKEELSLISGNLAELYKDGIAINKALELVKDITLKKSYKNSLSKVLIDIEEGKTLSGSFEKFESLYPTFFTGFLSIGENSGRLYEVLKGLSIYYNKVNFIKKEIVNASIYPIWIIVSLIIFAMISINTVMPSFYDIYNSMNIIPPQICIDSYEFNLSFKRNPFIMICSISSWLLIIPVIIIRYFLNKFEIKNFTKIGIVKSYYEYMMVLIFSIITSAGVNIAYALNYCESAIGSSYLKQKINEINNSVKKGNTLNESLEKTKMFSKYVLSIVKIREEAGTIEEGFKELNLTLENRLIKKIKRLISYLQPILIFSMGILILIFLIIVILPVFDNLKIGIR